MTAAQFCDRIHDIRTTLEAMRTEQERCEAVVSSADQELTDLEHEIELLPLNRDQLAQRARLMRNCRKRRREAKDALEVLNKIVPLFSKAGVFRAFDEAERIADEVRKRQSRRVYTPRVRVKEWREGVDK